MVKRFVKYNPAFLESDELIENFVVRQADLWMIMRIVRENFSASNQHVLVIGPRGSGKTTLVRRVAIEIERDEHLSGLWYPLIFAEESYNALSVADFWLEALFHLAEQTADEKRMKTWHELRRDPDEQRLGERALGQLLDFADAIGKRIMLVVENLDMLLSEFSNDDEAWKLRHTLMNEPRLMLLSTATGRFEQIDHLARPMFEMFKIHELKALDDKACNAVWNLIAGAPLPGKQIRPIRILTGGNVRLISLIAKFGAKRSFRELLDDLVDLIDEHTDYFKSHLDSMASTERKVFLALAELWSLSTAKEVAEAARLDVNRTSALLNRLVSRGKVVVEGEDKRKKRYRISEGIYNIFYLMRRRGSPSARVKAAVQFMIKLYGPEMAVKLLVDETGALLPDQCCDHFTAFAEILMSVSEKQRLKIAGSVPLSFLDSPYLDDRVRHDMLSYRDSVSGEDSTFDKLIKDINDLADKAKELYDQEQFEESMNVLDLIIDDYKGRLVAWIAATVATAMLNKGLLLIKMKRPTESIAIYEELVEIYSNRQEPEMIEMVATALMNMGIRYGEMSRYEAEFAAYQEIVDRYSDRKEVEIIRIVANALMNKGLRLENEERFEENIAVYDDLVERYRDRKDDEIIRLVATALVNKGSVLSYMNRSTESILSYDKAVELYGDRKEEGIVAVIASAMFNKGVLLEEMNRSEEALAVYESVAERYNNRQEAEIAEVVSKALVNKGLELGKLNRTNEAIAVYEEVIERYRERTESGLVAQVVKALLSISQQLLILEKPVDACITMLDAMEMKQGMVEYFFVLISRLLENKITEEALTFSKMYADRPVLVEQSIAQAIDLFVELAAYGYAEQVIQMLENSPAAVHLEPLVAGLRLYCGHEVHTAVEILEVGKDVVKRIEERKKQLRSRAAGDHSST